MSVKIFLCGLIYACQESFAGHDIVRCQLTQYGGTHSRENLSPAGTSHFPRPWVGHVRRTAPPDGRHVDEENGVRKRHFLPRFRKFRKTVKNWADIYTVFFT